MRLTYKSTIYAAFIGHVVQAAVNNYAPLLFFTFQRQFNLPLSKITLLISINFLIQLAVDLISSKLIDRIGYKTSMVLAHLFAFLGLAGLGIFPFLMEPFPGLLLSVGLYAVGGGITEVLLSPTVEACPTQNKEKIMSILHSFYCWGVVAVVILSNLFFLIFGIGNWRLLSLLWALLPLLNGIFFLLVPMVELNAEGGSLGIGKLLKKRIFYVLFILMIASGAAEQSMSQWASIFTEKALGISKTMGDLLGLTLFATLMGMVRAGYARLSDRIPIRSAMMVLAATCTLGYLAVGLSTNPIINLIGCAVIGFSSALFWPGTFMIAPKACPKGGTAMFALLALGGDLGCSIGPGLVGAVSSVLGDKLNLGLLSAVLFPLILVIFVPLTREGKRKKA